MAKRFFCVLLAVGLLFCTTACQTSQEQAPADSPAGDTDYQETAKQIAQKLQDAQYEDILQWMNADMKALSAKDWESVQNQIETGFGAFEKIGEVVQYQTDGYEVVDLELICERGTAIQHTVFDSQGLVAGFYTRLGPIHPVLPDGVTEQEISFQSQPDFPISGTLTLPKDTPKAAVVLVHGSGGQDRDSTIGFNKPFRDLAYGLAQQGFAVLRYDKITYTYGQAFTQKYGTAATVEEESILDAANAVRWLEQQDLVASDAIYVLGMSLGGTLLSSIGEECPDIAGYISLGGTPLPLWKISLEQNQMALQEQPADQQLLAQAVIDGEVQKAEHIEQYSDEELAAITVFGLPGMYAKHLFALQPAKLHLADQKPLLVLQGGKDRQVTPKNGLEAWEQALEGHPDATYKLYENLNHIMGDYQGDPVPFLQLTTVEYMQRTPVPAYVVDDIAAWINAHLA